MQNKAQSPKFKGPGIPTRKLLEVNVETIIKELEQVGMLHKDEFQFIIQSSISVLKFEPNILKTTSPAVVVGDIHGQFFDLVSIFRRHGLPPQTKYIFLGDYVDRGEFSIEVITLLFWLKLRYPKSIYLLRGNHQCRVLTNTHNFKTECKSKYNLKIYELVIILFEVLPICCIVDGKYFCVHAGISPHAQSLDQIQKISRFCEIPEKGVLCDLLWSDPTDDQKRQWCFNTMRSCSYFYSREHAQLFMKNCNLEMIIRGHEVQLEGYKYMQYKKTNKKNVLTVFSAPNYCDKYNNLGAVAIIQNNDISLQAFKNVVHPYVLPNNMNIFQWSIGIISRQAIKILVELIKSRFLSSNNKKEESIQQIKEKIQLNSKMQAIKKAIDEGETIQKQLSRAKDIKCISTEQDQMDPTKFLSTILLFICEKKKGEKDEAMPTDESIKTQIKEEQSMIYGMKDPQNLFTPCQNITVKECSPIKNPRPGSMQFEKSSGIIQNEQSGVSTTTVSSKNYEENCKQVAYTFGPKITNFQKINLKKK